MKIAVASNNVNKIEEFKKIFLEHNLNDVEFLTLQDLGLESDPEEKDKSLKGNALIKAKALYDLCGLPTISDDTGLFVEAIDGQPGVHSARFAGEGANDRENRKMLLDMMYGIGDREAYFKTIIMFVSPTISKAIVGRCDGVISTRESGLNGFGYDSVFIPNGFNKTFAQLEPEVKNKISHRYDAADKLAKWLRLKYLVNHF